MKKQFYIRSRRSLVLFSTIAMLYLCLNTGCSKFVEVDNVTDQLLNTQVFSNQETANSAINGIYRGLRDRVYNMGATPVVLTGLSSDELYNFTSDASWDDYRSNNIQANNNYIPWSSYYAVVYQCNAAIEGLSKSPISQQYKALYTAEAKFLRAFSYFHLVNYFGPVPLILTTDVTKNAIASRQPVGDVYSLIVNDLSEAIPDLPNDYNHAGGERIRANVWAAKALLARVYLYQNDWSNAATVAGEVINSSNYGLLSNIDSFAVKNNRESIFQYANTSSEGNSEPTRFIFTVGPGVLVTPTLLGAFETDDIRKTKWIKSGVYQSQIYYYPFKFKITGPGNEYYPLLRLAEQYLIRAEAKAQLDDVSGAQSDLDTLRTRAGLPNTTANDKPSLLLAVEHERRIELFAEGAHRWFDLKRTGKIDAVLSVVKGSNWQSSDALYPIPLSDVTKNPNLTQNDGY